MKIFFLTLALLVTGVAFIAPPLIVVLPALLVGVLLMASPLMMRSLMHGEDNGNRPRDGDVRRDQRPTSGMTGR